jgi:hypothetical protein
MCRPKHVEPLRNIGIINSTTWLHLVGFFYEIYITMHGSMNTKLTCLWQHDWGSYLAYVKYEGHKSIKVSCVCPVCNIETHTFHPQRIKRSHFCAKYRILKSSITVVTAVIHNATYRFHVSAVLLDSFIWHPHLTFRGTCVVIYSYNKSQRYALFLYLILVKNSTCFGQIYYPSAGVLILYSQQLVFAILVMLTVC